MFILIPSYQPNRKLINLIHQLQAYYNANILIVDDGSGPAYSHIFESLANEGCIVLSHENNKGKGAALKSGFEFLKEVGWEGTVVTAEGNDRHLARDIIRIGGRVNANAKKIILGSRTSDNTLLMENRIRNVVLSSFDSRMLDWLLEIPGNRSEYEVNMLLATTMDRIPVEEISLEA